MSLIAHNAGYCQDVYVRSDVRHVPVVDPTQIRRRLLRPAEIIRFTPVDVSLRDGFDLILAQRD